MIKIINVGNFAKEPDIYRYEIKINSETICNFIHRREDGLAECLRRAAYAVDEDNGKNPNFCVNHLFSEHTAACARCGITLEEFFQQTLVRDFDITQK